MTNPGFLVDGHMEKKFVQKVCPGKVVRILGCNGKTVKMSAIAKRVATHCRLLKGKCYPIIIVIDRESRVQNCQEIRDELLQEIKSHNINDDIIIGVADRMIENWILADFSTIKSSFKVKGQLQGCQDGCHGKKIISEHLEQKYHETTMGVQLLSKCRVSAMKNSTSFNAFISQLKDVKCPWLAR